MGRFSDWLAGPSPEPAPEPTPQPVVKAGAPGLAFAEVANRRWDNREAVASGDQLASLRGMRGLKTYRNMAETDATVGGILFTARMLMRSVKWDIEAASEEPEDIARAEFLEQCLFEDQSTPWPEFVSQALDMLVYGFSVHEIVWKRRMGDQKDPTLRSKFDDKRIGIRKFSALPADTVVEFLLDEASGLRGVKQSCANGATVEIPAEKLVIFRTDHRSWSGQSVLRTAVKAWHAKKTLEDYEAIGIERDLVGIPLLYAEAGYYAQYQTELQAMARNARNDEQAGFVLPDIRDEHGNRVVEFTVVQAGGSKAYDVHQTIGRYTRDIAASITQDVLLLGSERVGSFALMKEKRDLSAVPLAAWLHEIAETMQCHVVPRLFRMNGMPTDDLPKLVPGEIRSGDVEVFASAFKDATMANPDIVPSDDLEGINVVRGRLGLPPLAHAGGGLLPREMPGYGEPEPPAAES
jgi:hypothetical protein